MTLGGALAGWAALPANMRGSLWVLISVFFFAAQSAGIKGLAGELEPFQIVFLRCLLAATFIFPFALYRRAVRTRRPLGHFARGACGVAAMSCMVFAIGNARLADVTAIGFTKALFTVIIAMAIFHESVGWRRWAAVIVGFAGALIMLRPDLDGVNIALVAALGGSLLISTNIAIVKWLSSTEKPETIILYFGLIGGVLMCGPAMLVWHAPSTDGWLLLAAASVAGTLAQSCSVRAWATGEHSVLAPVQYIQLIFAAGFGFVLFSELPDVWTIAGAAIIVGATLYIARREAVRKSTAQGTGPVTT
jgi:drug/metabolite transporter (DMT)-like permease